MGSMVKVPNESPVMTSYLKTSYLKLIITICLSGRLVPFSRYWQFNNLLIRLINLINMT